MYNPFFTTKPAGEETGLGLSLSHDIIVKQHGGTVSVETQPGEFTEFTIVLPRRPYRYRHRGQSGGNNMVRRAARAGACSDNNLCFDSAWKKRLSLVIR